MESLQMNKVIIVGHSASGLAEIETQLRHYGMKISLPSRRESLYPQEITGYLCRAHSAPSFDIPTREADFKQIAAGPVWHNMAIDLFLGNMEQEWWGWADPQSVILLDYWRELDPLATFVLVYDEPQRALAESALYGAEEPDTAHIKQRLDNWAAYNGAMLRFFLRHPERCLLVHARQVQATPVQLVEQMPGYQNKPAALQTTITNLPGSLSLPPKVELLQNALALTTTNPVESLRILHNDAADRYLLNDYLSDQPAHLHLYEELQASASMPWHPDTTVTSPVEFAWKTLVAQRRIAADIITQLHQERYLLLTHLHQIQEQLEHLHLKNQSRDKQPPPKPKAKSSPNAAKAPRGAADRVKQQLSYRLGNILVKRSQSLGGCLGMPFSLVGEMRRYQKDKKLRGSKKLPPIRTYKDADEAQRVKNQLSYRLGSVLVTHIANPIGWCKLPFAMRHEIKAFKQTRDASLKLQRQTRRPSNIKS